MQWKEIDIPKMVWNVLPEHRKGHKDYVRPIPITKSMLQVFGRAQKRRFDPSDDALVFPGPSKGKKMQPTTVPRWIENSLRWEIKMTPHGLRSTLRDWMGAETNFPDVLWKIQVDHKRGIDETDSAYGHDLLTDRRREMMNLWDEYTSKLAPEPKVGEVLKLSDKRKRRTA